MRVIIIILSLFLFASCEEKECICEDISEKWWIDQTVPAEIENCHAYEHFYLHDNGKISVRRIGRNPAGELLEIEYTNIAEWDLLSTSACVLRFENVSRNTDYLANDPDCNINFWQSPVRVLDISGFFEYMPRQYTCDSMIFGDISFRAE